MAIYRDSSARHARYSTCDECETEDLTEVVTWKSATRYGFLEESKEIVLCPRCAVSIGAMLIGDAREASVAFRPVPFDHPEEAADPSLVTRKLRNSDFEDELL